MPLAVAGTAVLAIRTGQYSLINLVHALNRCYEDGLYFADYLSFCQTAERRIHRSNAAMPTSTAAQAEGQVEALRRFEKIAAEKVTFAYPGSDSQPCGRCRYGWAAVR